MVKRVRLAKLPDLIDRKLYKTGQTRGASTSEIYQNRVGRASTVLIPHQNFQACRIPDDGTDAYESGFIVLVQPEWYFDEADAENQLAAEGLELGKNALVYFQRPWQWNTYAVEKGMLLPDGRPLVPATARLDPLGGNYLARVPGTTATSGGGRVDHAYTTTSLRGAGIRVYEYASAENLRRTRLQLEALLWLCPNSVDDMVQFGMERGSAQSRRDAQLQNAEDEGLLDFSRLREVRMVDAANQTICPLCLLPMTVAEFATRSGQAEGRETWDNTITEASLFHINELRVGQLQHKPYNLGWGHHFCNVVVKDAGIIPTLRWMKAVVDANGASFAELDAQEKRIEEQSE